MQSKVEKREPDLSPAELTSTGPARTPEAMMGLAKGLAVLESFSTQKPRMTVTEAAKATGLSRAAVRRCLLTLTDIGYLNYDGKYYQPTPRLLRLSQTYLKVAQLPQIAQPFLETARDALQESISIAILEDGFSVFIARAEVENILTTGLRLGARLPAYSCATGRVLLSALSHDELSSYLESCELEKRTRKTLVDRSAIQREIRLVQKRNFAMVDEELEIGVRGLATPVRNSSGKIVAAASASTFAARISKDKMVKKFLPVLVRQAKLIGRSL